MAWAGILPARGPALNREADAPDRDDQRAMESSAAMVWTSVMRVHKSAGGRAGNGGGAERRASSSSSAPSRRQAPR